MTRPVVASIDLLALRQNLSDSASRGPRVAPVGGGQGQRLRAAWRAYGVR